MAIRNLLAFALLYFFCQNSLVAQSNYTLINDATAIPGCHCYQLTPDVGNMGGGVYQNNTINLNNSFDYKFSVFLGCNGTSGADGICFILTNNITGIGAQGGGLGYSGLPGNSLACEFDTYQNSQDPPYNHIAFESGGSVNHNVAGPVPALPSQANIDDCAWHTVEIIWNSITQTYTVYFDGNLRLSYTGNIIANFFGGNPIVNWGWSGSTGGSENTQQFCVNSTSNWIAGSNYLSCVDAVPFTDISTSNVASVQSWAWNFGDPASGAANTSSLQNPTHTFTGPGTYTVSLIITDISGCPDTFVHAVTVSAPITLTDVASGPPCNGGNNGNIALTISGGFGAAAGHGGFTYNWSNGQTAATDVGLTAGTYNVTVTDGICTTTASYTLSQPPALSATTSHVDAPCGGTGSATITITGGTPGYSNVTWDGIAATPGPNTFTTTGLAPGTVVANFQDANGCSALLSYRETIASLPCGYTLSSSSTNVTCYGGTNGTATLTVTGSIGTVTINWYNAGGGYVGSGSTLGGLPAGVYTYNYSDQRPQTFTGSVTINQPGGAMAVSISTLNTTCSYLNNGSAVASVTANGTPNYNYAWTPAGQPNSPTATGLSPGAVSVTVTDNNGCTGTASGTISGQTPLGLNVTTTPDSCFHDSTGTATVAVTGGTAGYTYLWSNSPTSVGASIFNVDAGNYVVTVTDHNGCTATSSGTVAQPPMLTATMADSNVACFGGSNGSATVTPAGGNGGFTYAWSAGGSTTATASGLGPNTYYVTVTDSKLCTVVDSAHITQPPSALAVTSTQVNVRCFGPTGSINLNISGGSAPYQTTWSDGPATGPSRTNLSAGTYGYTVTDAHLCTQTGSVTITQPANPFTLTGTQVNDSCFGGHNGSITLTQSGGTLPYAVPQWLDLVTGLTRTNLVANRYYVADSDANGCLIIDSFTITQPTQIVLDTVSTHQVSCFGGTDGAITLGVSGGVYPYTYSWPQAPAITDSLGVNLAAGTYTTYVTDANHCKDTITEVISQPAQLAPFISQLDSITCFGNTNGGVTVSATGGTSPYTYALDGSGTYQASGTFSGLSAGPHTVTVQDAHLCDSIISFNIYEPTQVTPTILYSRDVSCSYNCDGAVAVSVTGGVPSYSYSIDGVTFSPVDSFTALCPASYTITVKDAFGCTQTVPVTIGSPTPVTFSLSSATPPSCFGGSNGQIIVNAASGGTPGYLYSIDFGTPQASPTFNGLSAGLHILGVGDSHFCLDSIHILLSQPALLVADTISTQSISCFGGNNGAITIGVSGGTYPYSYVWPQAPAITDSLGVNLTAGTYATYITDANGCADTLSTTLSQPNALSPAVASNDSITCFGNNDGSVVVTVTGGTTPYSFSLDGGPTQGTGAFTGLTPGAHTVNILDAHNCDTTITFNTYEPPLLTDAIVSTVNDSCFGQCLGVIVVSATGGTLPYMFSIDGVNYVSSDTFSGLCANPSYTISVKDRNNCANNVQGAVTQPTLLVLSPVDSISPTCNFGQNGGFDVIASGGTPSYTYSSDGGPFQASGSFTNQGVGTHTVIAQDANHCTATYTITVINPPATSSYTATVINDSCFGGSTGYITINVTGTTTPYTYIWSASPSNGAVLGGVPAGTYTVTVKDGNNCTVISADSTNTISQPSAVGGSETMVPVRCYGGNNGCITVTDTGGTAPYTNSWSNGATTANPCGFAAGAYTDTITDSKGCKFIYANIPVTQPDSIAIIIDSITPVACLGGSNGAIAIHDTGGTAPYSYLWSNASTSPTPSGLTAGPYTVVVTDSHGCADTANVTVGTNPQMVLGFTLVNVLCPPLSNGRIILNVTGGAGGYQYLWSNGSTNSTISGLNVGIDSVVITDSRGCTLDTAFTIVNDSSFSITAVPDTATILQGDAIQLGLQVVDNSAGNISSVIWSPTTGINCEGDPNCLAPLGTPIITTQYNIVARTDSGCISNTSTLITVIPQHQLYVPNAFTPNHDGINDLWQAFGNKKAWILAQVEVYDRWGEKIFESNDINFGWDGKYRGSYVEPNVYTYVLKVVFVDDYSVSNKGTITVIR